MPTLFPCLEPSSGETGGVVRPTALPELGAEHRPTPESPSLQVDTYTMPGGQGYRACTRHTFQRGYRTKGFIPLTTYLRNYHVGDYVDIKVNGAVHKVRAGAEARILGSIFKLSRGQWVPMYASRRGQRGARVRMSVLAVPQPLGAAIPPLGAAVPRPHPPNLLHRVCPTSTTTARPVWSGM